MRTFSTPSAATRPFAIGLLLTAACAMGALLLPARPVSAQIFDDDDFPGAEVPGVWMDADGVVRAREVDKKELAAMRQRAKGAAKAKKQQQEKLAYVSLPKLLADARALVDAGKELPGEMKYLGGMTQIRYVFVYPEDNDLVIAGPAEEWEEQGEFNVVGKTTGRPVLHLDDLVVALRTSFEGRGEVFGCAIDPDPGSVKKAEEVALEYARASRKKRLEALQKALGPQKVRVFGTQEDTRFAFVCVAADYKLKRLALGLDPTGIKNLGHAVDNSRSAANRFWFEASFEPILVSPENDAYELRGPRLLVQAGKFSFDPKDATEKAKGWIKKFNQKLPELAVAVPVFADLQNVADLAIFATLVRKDGLAEKVGWDLSWVLDKNAGFPVAKIPVPREAETAVTSVSGSLAAGGVSMQLEPFVSSDARQADTGGTLAQPREEAKKARRGAGTDEDAVTSAE